MKQHSITIRHNFEAGHRLPHLEGKCQSLHGHSFWAEVTIAADSLNSGIIVEYGSAKAQLRGWIDAQWDHGLILDRDDALYAALAAQGKVFGLNGPPTVEYLAAYLGEMMDGWCRENNSLGHQPRLMCTHARVQETHVNAADWYNPEDTP